MNHCYFGLRIVLSVSVPDMYLLVLTLKMKFSFSNFIRGGWFNF